MTTWRPSAGRLVKPIQIPPPESFALNRFCQQILIRGGNKCLAAIFCTKIVNVGVIIKRHIIAFGNFHFTYWIDRIVVVIMVGHVAPPSVKKDISINGLNPEAFPHIQLCCFHSGYNTNLEFQKALTYLLFA